MAAQGFNTMRLAWITNLLIIAAGFGQAASAEPANFNYNSQSGHCEARSGDSQNQQRQDLRGLSPASQIVPVQALVEQLKTPDGVANEILSTPNPMGGNEKPPDPPGSAIPLPLETALEWTLSCNPDLVTIRQNLNVSADAVAVARRFPTSLNPTVSVNLQPWVFARAADQHVEQLSTQVSVSWMQPIEFGHRTAYRAAIANAAYSQTRWTILQNELMALVQTYRLHQAGVYRREKYHIAVELADFNRRLLETLKRQLQANQIPAADVVLAEVENQTTLQHVETARQEYVQAQTDLCQQIGVPRLAEAVELLGALQSPDYQESADADAFVRTALESRPEIRAARAQAAGSHDAVLLARKDRIPIPSIGPLYEKDQDNISFYGVALSSPIPVLNTGTPMLRQRESEYHRDAVSLEQTKQKVIVQVKTALIRCNEARRLLDRTNAITAPLQEQAARMDRLYEAGQSDLVKLFQVRQRLIEAENTRLDAAWQMIQAYADLLAALGATPLVAAVPDPSLSPFASEGR
jgi:cobalt-zinc-cadmium efflux system outer membrane protein